MKKDEEHLETEFNSNQDEHIDKSLEKILSEYDRLDLLKAFAGLQLIPDNHGKNIRLEILITETLRKGISTDSKIDALALEAFFETSFTDHYLEDPVGSFFTENLIFFDGNHVVFPGLVNNGTRLLNMYLEAIFALPNRLPEEYKRLIHDGVSLMLFMGDSMAYRMRLERYTYTKSKTLKITTTGTSMFNLLKYSVTIAESELKEFAEYLSIDLNTITNFLIDKDDRDFEHLDSDRNPLLKRPILKSDNEYVFLLPSAQVNALYEFIIDKAVAYNCIEELLNCLYRYQWDKTREMCFENGWLETSIVLPANDTELNLEETVFQFDNDKLAYIYFAKNFDLEQPWERISSHEDMMYEMANVEKTMLIIQQRIEAVLQHLDTTYNSESYRYFIIVVGGENGRPFTFGINAPRNNIEMLVVPFGDFEKLSLTKDIDFLTLWKFSKTLRETDAKVGIMNVGETVDTFNFYIQNHYSFLPSDDARPTGMMVAIGDGSDFEREILRQRDEHSELRLHEGSYTPVPVIKLREYAPLYTERIKSPNANVLIASYKIPVWVLLYKTKYEERASGLMFSEAVAFWLYKMQPYLNTYFNYLTEPVEILIELENDFLDFEGYSNIPVESVDIEIEVAIKNEQILIKIPSSISTELFLSDNSGERHIMTKILEGVNQLFKHRGQDILIKNADLSEIINKTMQPLSAKMILLIDTNSNIRLDTRWIPPIRTIQENETSKLLDNLVEDLNLTEPLPERISSKTEQNAVCKKIVAVMLNKVILNLAQFDNHKLLTHLMKLHEACIQVKEMREIRIPAQIACYSDYPTAVEKLVIDNGDLVEATSALRTVIEFIAANPQFGDASSNMDDIDQILAATNQLIQWGMTSDAVEMDLENPEIGLLASGRIGTNKTFWDASLKPFNKAKIETEIFGYQSSFDKKLQALEEIVDSEPKSADPELDVAFASEFGLTITEIFQMKHTLIGLCIQGNSSVAVYGQNDLIARLKFEMKEWSFEKIENGLNLLSLKKRESIIKAPPGYDKTDVYPWKYNRELSYLRKPIIQIIKYGEVRYYWSFRHVYSTIGHLLSLVYSGRLNAKKDGLLHQFVANINTEKGHKFRNVVKEWFDDNTNFKVIPYEVTINPKGHLIAEKDYGDIDLLVIDEASKIIYSIECKSTLPARVIHEIKSELDNYFGQNGQGGLVKKHVERDKWLKQNVEQLSQFVDAPNTYVLHSIILAKEDMPIMFTLKYTLPLPFFSFSRLMREGVELLKSE